MCLFHVSRYLDRLILKITEILYNSESRHVAQKVEFSPIYLFILFSILCIWKQLEV